MSTYICTFQDGSEALVHYGILGMKWGRRKDGLPQGTQGFGRSRGLSDNQKKWIKRAAIGAGVIGLGAAAHFTGADKAIINYVRNNKKRYLTYFRRTSQGLRTATKKVGGYGAKNIGPQSKAVASKMKQNASRLKTSAPAGSVKRAGSVFKPKSPGPARSAAQQKLGAKPRSIFSAKGQARVNSVLNGRPKPPPHPSKPANFNLNDYGVDAGRARKVASSSRDAADDFVKAQKAYAKKKRIL